jgi:LysR family transcriptional regulator, cyn operon transcriptional activator
MPVDDRGLEVGGIEWVSEALFMSRSRERTAAPITMHQLAQCNLILFEVNRGNLDPMRRQLLGATQNAGVRLDPVIEVESPLTAVELAERGVGDTRHSAAGGRGSRCDPPPPLHPAGATTARDLRLRAPP